ncbi:hypothetical protein LCER1_G006832 [Lachnellula cervina]|uniref:DUF7708 domain-containing protein n=1 Tax=Lachnellula cervina TaxID=1316786 RepID=A0A7D8YYC3_9HELO|nr:hypothetical protein LCER1_G006832 [Lachnellula cervina]
MFARSLFKSELGSSGMSTGCGRIYVGLLYYGHIMDVLIQQHPQYVSLVWGAIRFLVVGGVNQQKLISRLSSGLCQIAEVLPRAELIIRLYPIPGVRHLISNMYAHILRFLLRSLRWYQESKLSHLIHAITRPVELRFGDLVEEIRVLSSNMDNLALASGHAEQRDMHTEQKKAFNEQNRLENKVDLLTKLVEQLKETIVTDQAINASARIELRQDLSDIQVGQLLGLISNSALLDPIKSLQAALFMRSRGRQRERKGGPSFLNTKKLRFEVKNFCSDSITLLRQKQTPVIWALKAIESDEIPGNMTSNIDLLKYLISQALHLNRTIHTDAAVTPRLKSYWEAQTESDWFKVLASVLQGIPLLYIIVDVELLHPSLPATTEGFSWPASFRSLFAGFIERNIKTILRVALVSYGSPIINSSMKQELRDSIIPVIGFGRAQRGPEKAGSRRLVRGGKNG